MKVALKKPVRSSRKVAKPELTLKAAVSRIKAESTVMVKVGMKGLDRVDFTLEPRGAFTLDLDTMAKPGIVRLRGKKDGTATLIATGRVGSRKVVEKMVHIYCEGPVVRILAYGYIPGE